MRILHIGDIVGKPGRRIIRDQLADIRKQERIDFVVANGENATDGSGISPEHFQALRKAGVDCVTLGDHIYRRKQIATVLESDDRIIKPANYPATAPGRGWTVVPSDAGPRVAVISVIGRVFMKPADCPFRAVDEALEQIPDDVHVILVDFHAEATSDKQLMGRYLDGRVSTVLGTHTHVATADEQILSKGTAFQCDLGMTGPHDSILGRRVDRILETTTTFYPTIFDVAQGDVRISGSIVDIDSATGRATSIRRVSIPETAR